MTDNRTYLHPVAFVVLHIVAVLLTMFAVLSGDVAAVWWFVAPVIPVLAPLVPLFRVDEPGRRKVYLISIAIAIMIAIPILAWLGLAYFAFHGKIG